MLEEKKKKIIYVDVDIGPVKHKQKIAGFLLPKKPDMQNKTYNLIFL